MPSPRLKSSSLQTHSPILKAVFLSPGEGKVGSNRAKVLTISGITYNVETKQQI